MNMLRQRIQELESQHGGLRQAARVLEVDHAYLWRLKNNEKSNPGDKLLQRLGLKKVVAISYQPTRK